MTLHKIFVVVRDGEATVQQDTVPDGVIVEVIDMDKVKFGDPFPSQEAYDFCVSNQLFTERRKRSSPTLKVGRREWDSDFRVA